MRSAGTGTPHGRSRELTRIEGGSKHAPADTRAR
jgi:hypothetical protein